MKSIMRLTGAAAVLVFGLLIGGAGRAEANYTNYFITQFGTDGNVPVYADELLTMTAVYYGQDVTPIRCDNGCYAYIGQNSTTNIQYDNETGEITGWVKNYQCAQQCPIE